MIDSDEKKKDPTSAKDILSKYDFVDRFAQSAKYIKKEYQDYGVRLAHKLNDEEHKSLYIRMAKDLPREILAKALTFTSDYPTKKPNKGKLFMWKVIELCKENNVPFQFSKRRKRTKGQQEIKSRDKSAQKNNNSGRKENKLRRKNSQLDLFS